MFSRIKIRLSGFMFAVALLLCCFTSHAQDPNFHIYLCFGQSNMEGQGTIENQDRTVDSRFQILQSVACSGQNREAWRTATPPLSRCNTGLGPADYFGRKMVENLPANIKVGVVHVAIAGCKIELFDKNNYAAYVNSLTSNEQWMKNIINEYGGNPYARLVALAKIAQQSGVIKGILLHQGESNTGDNSWPNKVKGVYDNLLADLGLNANDVPLLAGQVVDAAQGGQCAAHNAIINNLPNVIPTAHVISSSGCTDVADNLHFSSAGYRLLGTRYAEKMLTLVKLNGISVQLTAPAANATVETGTAVTITATATATGGTISKVEFYAGTTLIGSDNTSPYSVTWTPAAAGTYAITAKATDNQNNTSTSAAVSVKVSAPQSPYNNTPHAIPGVIQAEEFDLGGNGLAYNDGTPGSQVTPVVNFRTDEDVDIESCTDAGGGYNVGWATAGEWLEYTVNVQTAGTYNLDLRVACSGTGRTVSVSMDGATVANALAIPNTNGWQTWSTVTVNDIPLQAGSQVMRITIGQTDYVNINYFEFKPSIVTGIKSRGLSSLELFPNPFTAEGLQIRKEGAFNYRITDISGAILEEGEGNDVKFAGRKLAPGIYMLFVENNNGTYVNKVVKE